MADPQIVSEQERYYVLNKPAGYVVNDSLTAHGNFTLQDWVSRNLNTEISADDQKRNGIVHRLDKETSGMILVAKDYQAMLELQKLFANSTVTKVYKCLVHGKMISSELVSAPIGRLPKNRTKFGVVSGGRDAATEFTPLSDYVHDGWDYTLIEARPKTGRTHQIRVHALHIKHPVVSDPKYLGDKAYKSDLTFCPRLFLHAALISFVDPFTNSPVTFESSLPSDLSGALERLTVSN